MRKNDFSKPWVIWDIVTLAYLEGMTKQESQKRPVLNDDMSFRYLETDETITWITHVDSKALWGDFLLKLDAYERTHNVHYAYTIDPESQ